VAFPAAALIDALLGQGLGTGAAGAGAGLAAAFRPSALAPAISNIQRTLSTVTQSFAPSLGLMLVQFGKSFQSLAPMLAKLFAASLPFMQQFLSLALVAAKTILPALTQALEVMVKSGALKAMTQGFVFVIQGIAGFIRAIGPGFKAGAEVFRALALGVKGILTGLGAAFGWMGKTAGDAFTVIHKAWDSFRHWFAGEFDYWRHWWASSWLEAWHTFVNIWHDIVGAASSAWDLLVKAAKTGVATVVSFFTGLPGKALRALWGLGHSLYSFARSALGEFWNGLKSIWDSVWGWIKKTIGGIPHDIMSFLGMSPPHAGSAFYDLGANMMHHLEAGIKSHARSVAGAAAGAAGRAAGAAGTGVQRWAPAALQALRMLGQPSSDLGVVLAQMQTESGGNPVIVNKWDSNWAAGTPSVGLMQVIGPTYDAYAGPFRNVGPFEYGTSVNPLANIYAGLNYAIHRYGPAWTRVLGQGHGYDQGGWLPPGVTLAVNRTGVPERVLPPGSATGNTYITVQVGHGTHPVAAAQEIVKLLNAGAKSGVKLRTSILGPG
jgi:SLT domain-containing protein